MKRLSFQWRIALLTSLLITLACIALNLLVGFSGAYYFDTLGAYVVEYSGESLPEGETASDEVVIIDMTPDEFAEFYGNFTQELIQAKTGFEQKSWSITVFVALFSGVIAYFVSGRSLRPLREFSAQTEQVGLKNLTEIRLNEDTIPEFQALSRSINRMLARLSTAFDAQKQFTGNAAHELRTPLALMQTRLDLYRDEHQGEQSETMETVTLLSEQTERLSHLVKTLLDMSELEEISRSDRVRLSPLAEEVLADLAPLAEKNGVALEQTGGDVVLTGSDTLLYRLLFNLVENGIKYNRPNGRVTVFVGEEGTDAVLRVSDTGPGIPEGCRESVFQPFFRTDKARSRSMGGVGLGLSLVWEIARLHGGTVYVKESTPEGTVFEARLQMNGAMNTGRQRMS